MDCLYQGKDAEIYYYTEDKILKLFPPETPAGRLSYELSLLEEVHTLEKICPQPFQVLVARNRKGILMESISSPTLRQLLKRRPFSVFEYANQLAKIHLRIEGMRKPDSLQRFSVTRLVDRSRVIRSPLKNLLKQFIAVFPERAVCHGQLHTQNIVLRGENGPVVFDWSRAFWGPSLLDKAITYQYLKYVEKRSMLANHYCIQMRKSKEVSCGDFYVFCLIASLYFIDSGLVPESVLGKSINSSVKRATRICRRRVINQSV